VTCRWPINLGFALVVGLLAFFLASEATAADPDWTVLDNCQLVPNEGNDGDSFHVRANDKEYIFRLYFVDAPEIEAVNPARLIEQAKYFGISVPQVIDVGQMAKVFVERELAEPFTVITRMASAMGRSRKERFYGFVETKEGDLGELLVENGLARAFGTGSQPPGVESQKLEWDKLAELENAAKQQKIGGWGETSGRLNVRAAKGGLTISNFAVGLQAKAVGLQRSPAVSAPAPGSRTLENAQVNTDSKTDTNKLDVNKATEEQLERIPGIGKGLAGRIIAARPFKSADDLRNVKGIGSGPRYEKIRPYFN
jgi:DNA uptake protein ComE-like DNA-binding protein